MSLVQYSDTDSDSEPSPPRKKVARPAPNPAKTTTPSLPPLPASFHSLYASSTRVSTKDDPSLHAGRKRAIPHVEGNWPTHLYLEWVPGKEEVNLLADLIQAAGANTKNNTASSSSINEANQGTKNGSASTIHSLLHSDLGAQLPLHISLSRPVVLRTEQRASFTECLAESLGSSNISRFHVTLETLKWVSNYEKTRWFLVLRVSRPESNNLNRLLHLCNSSLHRFGQPPLYAGADLASNPGPGPGPGSTPGSASGSPSKSRDEVDFSGCFHISIAWCLRAPDDADMDRVSAIKLDKVQAIDVHFQCMKAKIGNYVESFDLPVQG